MRRDFVIIGGGVVGSSIAYNLAAMGAGSVVVIERDKTYARASSALSASSIRQQFTTPVCMEMSRFGFEFLKTMDETLAVEGDRPDVGLVEQGYLYLATTGRAQNLRDAYAIQTANNVPVRALARDELEDRFGWLNPEDIELGVLGTAAEGWFDGYSLMQAYRAKARELGVTYLYEDATGLSLTGARVAAVECTRSGRIEGEVFVNAAGPHSAHVSGWAGFALPVRPEKRTIFAFNCPDPIEDMPLLVDASGLYVRPEGTGFISGGPAWLPEADPADLEPDWDQFDEFIWPTLAHRVPAFERIKMTRAWAGHYEMCTFDHNGLIGWTPGVENLVTATGFSGHGMQHAPATGRGVAELITAGRYETIDLTPLSLERLVANTPIKELNVI